MTDKMTLAPDASVFTRFKVGLKALMVLRTDNANPYYARLLHVSFDRDTCLARAE